MSRSPVFACNGHHSDDSPHTSSRAALTSRLVTLLVAPASSPHTSDPMACPPMKINWYTDNPRARTHAGRLNCIDALSVDNDNSQAAPPTTRRQQHDDEIVHQRQHCSGHGETRRAPTVSNVFCPNRARIRDNRNAPSTAPTPSAPSSSP